MCEMMRRLSFGIWLSLLSTASSRATQGVTQLVRGTDGHHGY